MRTLTTDSLYLPLSWYDRLYRWHFILVIMKSKSFLELTHRDDSMKAFQPSEEIKAEQCFRNNKYLWFPWRIFKISLEQSIFAPLLEIALFFTFLPTPFFLLLFFYFYFLTMRPSCCSLANIESNFQQWDD